MIPNGCLAEVINFSKICVKNEIAGTHSTSTAQHRSERQRFLERTNCLNGKDDNGYLGICL